MFQACKKNNRRKVTSHLLKTLRLRPSVLFHWQCRTLIPVTLTRTSFPDSDVAIGVSKRKRVTAVQLERRRRSTRLNWEPPHRALFSSPCISLVYFWVPVTRGSLIISIIHNPSPAPHVIRYSTACPYSLDNNPSDPMVHACMSRPNACIPPNCSFRSCRKHFFGSSDERALSLERDGSMAPIYPSC